MSKISAYSALAAPDDEDLLLVVDVSDTSMSASGTTKSMTLAELLASFDNRINAHLQFGADPTGTVAADTALANALLAATDSGLGQDVYLQPGSYKLDGATALAVTAGCGIVTDGPGSAFITLGSNFGDTEAILISGADKSRVRDLGILGASSTLGNNPTCTGIKLVGSQFVSIDRCFFQYINGWAIESIGSSSKANIGCRFERITSYNCSGGIHIQGVSGSAYGGQQWITNPHISQTGIATGLSANLDCIKVEDCSDVFIEQPNCAISYVSTGSALKIAGNCSAVAVISPDLGCFPATTPASPILIIKDTANGSPTDIRVTGGVCQAGLVGAQVDGVATRVGFNGTSFKNNVTHGVSLTGSGTQVNFSDCTWSGNGAGGSGSNYELSVSSTVTGRVLNCHFLTAITAVSTPGVQAAVNLNSSGQDIQFIESEFRGTSVAPSTVFNTNLPSVSRKCKGYNPHGAQTVSVPATTASTSALHYDAMFYITAGASTCTLVCNTGGQGGGTGPSIVIPSGGFTGVFVPAQQTVTFTYSSAPTMVVAGL